ncbi:MAG TPA: hypothetical protein VN903_17680 [Polyangia bacterium]|nr:hypothetical protein [Polyangia bacterium]
MVTLRTIQTWKRALVPKAPDRWALYCHDCDEERDLDIGAQAPDTPITCDVCGNPLYLCVRRVIMVDVEHLETFQARLAAFWDETHPKQAERHCPRCGSKLTIVVKSGRPPTGG